MEEKKEIFLGQKESVARYNLDTQTVTWSAQVKGTPSLISVYKDHLIVQGLNKWGTKYIQHCLEASSGKLLWFSEEFKGIVVPHFIDDDVAFEVVVEDEVRGRRRVLAGPGGERDAQQEDW